MRQPAMYSTKPAPPLRKVKLPRLSFDPALPVSARREEIRAAIERHQVVIVCGETGSGKTTQLPKILLEMGRGAAGLIGHTQPRRIAARSVAARIAEELGSELGAVVGYKVRFQDRLGPDAAVKLMTDGILLAETQGDPQLRQYDTIVIDEAHERSLNIDFLLGYLVRLLPRRPELKLVITSATIDAERFSRHFGGAPVIEVSGRLYPVEVRYRPVGGDAEDTTRKEEEQALAGAVDELCAEGPGDVLVFLPGEREIRDAAEVLRKHHPPGTELLPLYSRLSAAEQDRVFRPGRRAAHRARDQRCRDLAHGAAHPVRGRYRPRARQALQLPQQGRAAAGREHLAGRRQAARRALRARRRRRLHPPLRARRITTGARRSPIRRCCARRLRR